MPPEVILRDQLAAAIAGQLTTLLSANEGRNLELCRGAEMLARGLAIDLRVWDAVRAQVVAGEGRGVLEG
jgi:hypothetical protein